MRKFSLKFNPIVIVLLCAISSVNCFAHPSCLGDARSKKIYSVYVVPQSVTSDIFSVWAPFLEKLGQDTAQCFDLRLSANIPEFERSLMSGEPDFAFANPYHAVMAKKTQGYQPLIRDEKSRLIGLIVVKKNGPVKKISDLDGKNMAFPAPNSFAASLLIRNKLSNKKINIKPIYVKTHANVYRSVLVGDAVAGGAVNITYDREDPELINKLNVIDTTNSFAPHPFIVNPRIGEIQREVLIKAFLAFKESEGGKKLLNGINIPVPVRSYYSRDYEPLEHLDLDRFVVRE